MSRSNLFVILILALLFSSCAIHDYFPFICFERGCVQQQLNLKGLKKRMKGKLVAMNRKRNKKKPAGQKNNSGEKEPLFALKGRTVEYHRYLLLFRLQRDPWRLDSLVVEHTSQYKTLIEVDQARLGYMIDTTRVKNILMIYIKACDVKKEAEGEAEHAHEVRSRLRAIRRFIQQTGVPPARIKVLQDSLSPPRL